MLEEKIREQPKDPRLHNALGLTFAGLGQKEEAIREGILAIDMMPISKSAWFGPHHVRNFSVIYIMVGEYNAAIDHLNLYFSSQPIWPLELPLRDPRLDPLRDHPRFQTLVEKYRWK